MLDAPELRPVICSHRVATRYAAQWLDHQLQLGMETACHSIGAI